MAKATVTVIDTESGINVSAEFDPELDMKSDQGTNAQFTALMLLEFLQARAGGEEALYSFVKEICSRMEDDTFEVDTDE